MKNEKIENWELVKDRLKKEYPHLTEDDLIYEAGKEEELLLRLQQRLKKNKEEIRKYLSFVA
jgi:hypothetical protein